MNCLSTHGSASRAMGGRSRSRGATATGPRCTSVMRTNPIFDPWLVPRRRDSRRSVPKEIGSLIEIRVRAEQAVNPKYLGSGHILFAHPNGGLFVVPFDLESKTVTGERTPVFDDIQGNYYNVSASGTLVFRSRMTSGAAGRSQQHLVRVGLDGTLDTLRLAPRSLSGTRISPDGRRLVYNEVGGGDDHLYLYDFELGGPTQLTFEGDNNFPVWSPDGSRIAFASSREGSDNVDIYVKPVDGSGAAELLLTRPGWQFPENWTEDGTVTFYEVNNGPPDLWTVPADSGGSKDRTWQFPE